MSSEHSQEDLPAGDGGNAQPGVKRKRGRPSKAGVSSEYPSVADTLNHQRVSAPDSAADQASNVPEPIAARTETSAADDTDKLASGVEAPANAEGKSEDEVDQLAGDASDSSSDTRRQLGPLPASSMRKRTRRSTVAVTPREQDNTGKDAYEIEEILKSKRGRSQQVQSFLLPDYIQNSQHHPQELSYLVKWKGYSKAHNSWVPEADVDAPVLVKAFEKRPKAATTSQQDKPRRGRK